MMERHEEKYLLSYGQYVLLRQKAAALLKPDPHGKNGSYTVTSLYYDDPMDTALLEKQDGLARHTPRAGTSSLLAFYIPISCSVIGR